MIDDIKNELRERLDMSNLFLGILFILLTLITLNILNFDFTKNSLYIYLNTTISKDYDKIPIFESIILIFIINIIGYLTNFILNIIYLIHEQIVHDTKMVIKHYYNFALYYLKDIKIPEWMQKILNFIYRFFKTKEKNIHISQKVIYKALSDNSKLLEGITNHSEKYSMSFLYLSLLMRKKNETLYKDFKYRINKLKFYQNIIGLIVFDILFLIIVKAIENISLSNNNLNMNIYILFFLIISPFLLIIIYSLYKTFQDNINIELLVFMEILDKEIK